MMNSSWLRDLNQKSRSNSAKTFKSYIDLNAKDANENQTTASKIDEDFSEKPPSVPYLTPSLLPGELVIVEAENVLKFNSLSELNKGVSGLLSCTNFKLRFLTAETFPSNLHQRNLFLGENDICLINIDAVYHVIGNKRKKISSANIVSNIEILEIHCKDFRIYTFCFKFSPANRKAIVSAILHHAFASRINLLFAFDYNDKSPMEKIDSHSLNFTEPSHWEAELTRCDCSGWRISLANEKFFLCDNLPECFVVPAVLLDMNLIKAAPYFYGHRLPTWSWGKPSGASIVRMAALDLGISDTKQFELVIDAISQATPYLPKAEVLQLDELCPSVKDIQNSYVKLKELCMPTTAEEYWETDNVYLSRLESTKWLNQVSACLSVAQQATMFLEKNTTVVLSESEGRDVNCIVSSLIQLYLDPLYRKQFGFQQLIQKEWISLGHSFTERLHHISNPDAEESPVFLLFLDCVWQVMQQCPAFFEFSETYLTTLWDSCHMSLFDTFLFSSHKVRSDALRTNNIFRLRSVWNWTRQFSRNDIKLFQNPLYLLNRFKTNKNNELPSLFVQPRSFNSVKGMAQSHHLCLSEKTKPIVWAEYEEDPLKIDFNMKSLSIWHQCYFRWIPLAQVLGGGSAALFLSNMKVADEIVSFEIAPVRKMHQTRPPSLHRRFASDDFTISLDAVDICHVQDSTRVVTSAFPFAPVAPWDWQDFQFLPSTPCLQISYSSDDDLDD